MDIRTDTKEITEKKIKLEKEIARKMEEFEKETGLIIYAAFIYSQKNGKKDIDLQLRII